MYETIPKKTLATKTAITHAGNGRERGSGFLDEMAPGEEADRSAATGDRAPDHRRQQRPDDHDAGDDGEEGHGDDDDRDIPERRRAKGERAPEGQECQEDRGRSPATGWSGADASGHAEG